MAITLKMSDKVDLNASVDGGPFDDGVVYQVDPLYTGVISVDSSGIVTPLAVGSGVLYIKDSLTNALLKKIIFVVIDEDTIVTTTPDFSLTTVALPNANLPSPLLQVVAQVSPRGWLMTWENVDTTMMTGGNAYAPTNVGFLMAPAGQPANVGGPLVQPNQLAPLQSSGTFLFWVDNLNVGPADEAKTRNFGVTTIYLNPPTSAVGDAVQAESGDSTIPAITFSAVRELNNDVTFSWTNLDVVTGVDTDTYTVYSGVENAVQLTKVLITASAISWSIDAPLVPSGSITIPAAQVPLGATGTNTYGIWAADEIGDWEGVFWTEESFTL